MVTFASLQESARGRRFSDVKASLGGDDAVMGGVDGYKSAASRGGGRDGGGAMMGVRNR